MGLPDDPASSRPERERPSPSEFKKEVEERQLEILQAAKTEEERCGCGLPMGRCAPQNCSHKFAFDALWGD